MTAEEPPSMSASHISRTSASDTDCAKRRLNLLPGGLVDLEDRGLAGRLVDRPAGKPFGLVQVFIENATAIQDQKERGVLDQLPEAERPWVRAKLRKAWRNPDVDQALRDLRALAGLLNRTAPDAAINLVEGLEEMLMALRMEEPLNMSASHASNMSASDTERPKRRLTALPGGRVDLKDRGLARQLVDRP